MIDMRILGTLLASLNATDSDTGSAQMGTSAARLAASTTSPLYTGGITLTNADTAIQLWYSTTTTAAVHGVASKPIPPGQSEFVPKGDLYMISVIAESGTPYVSWQANRL